VHDSTCPGSSFCTPRKNVSSVETKRLARNSGSASSLNCGRMTPAASPALHSLHKQQLFLGAREIEGFTPEPIAGQQQPLPRTIPNREGKHAVQAVDHALAFLLVEMEDGLGVAAGAVAVAARFESRPERGVVVDLAVEDDPDRAVLVAHRLPAAAAGGEGAGGVEEDE